MIICSLNVEECNHEFISHLPVGMAWTEAAVTSSPAISELQKPNPKFQRLQRKPLNWKIMMFDLLNHLFIGQKAAKVANETETE
jgi:hypothetical protein